MPVPLLLWVRMAPIRAEDASTPRNTLCQVGQPTSPELLPAGRQAAGLFVGATLVKSRENWRRFASLHLASLFDYSWLSDVHYNIAVYSFIPSILPFVYCCRHHLSDYSTMCVSGSAVSPTRPLYMTSPRGDASTWGTSFVAIGRCLEQ